MDRSRLDASLLIALDALLSEQSVTRAAEQLHTSPASMSRTLGRLRRTLGDPLLVRAGHRMVPTPRARAMQAEVAEVVRQCVHLLTPGKGIDPATLRATFTVQAADLILAGLAPGLLELASTEAPQVSIRFAPETLEGSPALRDGITDLQVGVLDHVDPETVTEDLLALVMTAVMRRGHPLASGELTPARFADASHVAVSRLGRFAGPVDSELAKLGLRRRIVAVLPSHLAAMTLAARTDLVCLVPVEQAGYSPAPLRELTASIALLTAAIPVPAPRVAIGMAWHPRNAADGGHAWLRSAVRRSLHVFT